MQADRIYTGIKFFGRKVFVEGFGDEVADAALKQLFYDSYTRTRPLEMRRPESQIVLEAAKKQKGLFE